MSACPECGLPMVECNALALARLEVTRYLRDNGYKGLSALDAADRLIPLVKRKTISKEKEGKTL